jgi:hypothetical protein
MMEVFDGMVYLSLLIWIYYVLLFAKTFEDYLQVLKQSFERLRKFNVKFNPNKTDICSCEITWCGRKISEAGIRFDDSPIQALLQLPEATTADQLQKIVCAANWIGVFVLLAAPEENFSHSSVQNGLALIELSRRSQLCVSG